MTKTRKFCCCFPTRLGVLILSPLTCAFSTVCSVISLYALARHYHSLDLAQRIFLGFLGATMALVALTSIFGFFGAILANYKMVNMYSSSLYTLFFSVLITGCINFGITWHHRDDFIRNCRAENEGMSKKDCRETFDLGWGLTLGFWIAAMFVALYLIRIVRHYAEQLADKQYTYAANNMAQYHSA